MRDVTVLMFNKVLKLFVGGFNGRRENMSGSVE